MVMPVSYRLVDEQIVFRTRRDTHLGLGTHNSVVAFEVDDIDPDHHTGWSVDRHGDRFRATGPAAWPTHWTPSSCPSGRGKTRPGGRDRREHDLGASHPHANRSHAMSTDCRAHCSKRLDHDECLQLLAAFSVGRIAVGDGTRQFAVRRAGELRARRRCRRVSLGARERRSRESTGTRSASRSTTSTGSTTRAGACSSVARPIGRRAARDRPPRPRVVDVRRRSTTGCE